MLPPFISPMQITTMRNFQKSIPGEANRCKNLIPSENTLVATEGVLMSLPTQPTAEQMKAC